MIKGVLPQERIAVRTTAGRVPRVHIDHASRRIIELLQADGRRSCSSLAGELDLPEDAIDGRIRELVDAGVIMVTAVSDPLRLGFTAQAMLGIQCELGMARVVADRLAELREYVYIVLAAGSFDVIAELFGRAEAELQDSIELLEQMPGVAAVQSYRYAGVEKLTHTWDVWR